jgi:multiple sugar transport system substrate-binding protein
MNGKKFSRRDFMRAASLAAAGTVAAACAPKEVFVTKEVVVTQQVQVEVTKEVEKQVQVTVVAPAKKEAVHLNFFNRGGEYVFQTMDLQIAEFKKTHPDWTFELNSVAGYSHQEALLMMLAAGTGPDCWFDSVRTTGLLSRKGVVEPLDDYLKGWPAFKMENFTKNTFSCQIYDGKIWGIPWDSGALLIMYNKDLFDKAKVPYPDTKKVLTWDEMITLAKQLTFDMNGKTPNDAGFDPARVKQYGFLPDKGHGRQTYIWSNGGEIIESDMTMPIDTPAFTEAMNWLADLGLKHFVSPSAKYQTAQEIVLPSMNVAMEHGGVWSMGEYLAAGVNLGYFMVPYSKKQATYGQYSPMCVYTGSKLKDQAFEFIYFCTADPVGQKIIVDRGQLQPTLNSLREAYLNGTPGPNAAERQLAYDVFENPDTYRWPGDKIKSYWGGWYQYFIDLWEPYMTEVWIGNKRWEDVSAELRPKSEQLLKTGEVPTS